MVRRVVLERANTDEGRVAGIDEVGRGPWAGPVVAAAVMLNGALPENVARRIDDSKKLSAATRQALFEALAPHATIGIGQASVDEIDALNILNATHLAMQRAVEALGTVPSRAMVDGNSLPTLPCPATPVIGGDALVLEIAAASIIAKVCRDRLMAALGAAHPGYGWERNAGYGTAEHRAGLAQYGVTAHHRRSFAPIRMFLQSS
ncbi:MAG: ribonuclease HII [Alphaproteobacteria bacterium]|nr:ribonuclease HII [Alphaproteobacteria bacterium]